MSIVVCRLPKAGLGNHLFPLMNAHVFAHLNNLPVIVVGYHHLKLGPYLRKEKIKRKYKGYFKFQKSLIGEKLDQFRIKLLSKKLQQIHESPVEKLSAGSLENKMFIFEKLPTYHNYFIHLTAHRELVIQLLHSLINPWIIEEVKRFQMPVVGVHVRMGDFRKLKEGEDFSRVGHVRTPEDYFIDCIDAIRSVNKKELPVSVFTDGYRHEFEKLFTLDNITMVEGNADIVDLLLLSKSQIIVAANGSTFSYWAGFLSNAALIKHPDHLYAPFRPQSINSIYYEGPLNAKLMDPLLKQNLQSIL